MISDRLIFGYCSAQYLLCTNSVLSPSTTTSSTMNSDFAMSHGDLLRTAVRAASLCALTHSARGARSASASPRKYFCFAAAPRAPR